VNILDRGRLERGPAVIRHRAAARLIIAIVAAVAGGGAQPAIAQSPGAPTGAIVGRAVDADAGTPVSGVAIVALGEQQPGPGARPPVMLTDAQGRLAFRNLAKGSYTLIANVGGNGYSPSGFLVTGTGHQIGAYLNGGFGQRRPNGPLSPIELDEGERIPDAVIRMWRGGAINGRVEDEAGEPVVDAVVSAVPRSSDGKLLTGPTTTTDNRGVYRLGTLTPGEYGIGVANS
jgi:hypothetical protein